MSKLQSSVLNAISIEEDRKRPGVENEGIEKKKDHCSIDLFNV